MRTTTGQKIKERRRAMGLKQKDLAERAGISVTTLRNWEQDRYEPTLFGITCLADVLGLSLDFLAGRTDRKS
jgi:transcriptional regulator with XRE-family HTH domain